MKVPRPRLRHIRKRRDVIGARPGSLAIAPTAVPSKAFAITYNSDSLHERNVTDVTDLRGEVPDDEVTWIDVQGLADAALLKRFAAEFSFHPLLLEEVANAPRRPKAEDYDRHLAIITRMLRHVEGELDREQLGIVVGTNYVITFQERYGDVLDPVRNRLRTAKGRMRNAGPDYLAYAILDTVIDGYFPVLEHIGDVLEALDEQVLSNPTAAQLHEVHKQRKSLAILRRLIWPQREALNALVRDGSSRVSESVQVYFRDTLDHGNQVAEFVESYRELSASLVNAHLSALSNRTNEVMKVLTIMASIFIPLTFIAGIYGMNFEQMPELSFKWSYPLVLVTMVCIAVVMLFAFRRRGWIGSSDRSEEENAGDHKK